VTAGAGGKSARTRFFPLETYSGCVLTKVQLFTGRTHQIRVHAAAIGLPVAGDSKYGQEGGWRPPGLTRLFLHAERLLLPHPTGSGEIEFTAPLDERLESVLSRLRP